MKKIDSPPPDLVQFVARDRAKTQLAERLIAASRLGASLVWKSTPHKRVERLLDPSGAKRLFDRRNQVYRGTDLAQAMLQAFLNNSAERLNQLIEITSREGALIERLPIETLERRIRDPDHWVIMETTARHPDPTSRFNDKDHIVADCQCAVPDDVSGARSVVPVSLRLDPANDYIYDPNLHATLNAADPSTICYIDQICVQPDFAHLGCAAEARHKGLVEVANLDRANPIEHMIGLAFSIQGLQLQNGAKLYAHTYHMRSITNMITLLVNEQSKRCPATIVGRKRDALVPVKFCIENKEEDGHLIVDWYILDHLTEHIAR